MLKLIYKTIWNEKHINTWILIELVLIFSILFFCTDFAYKRLSLYLEPLGFDIEHTYSVVLGNKNRDIDKEESFAIHQQMIENLKRHSSIENVCISTYTPYSRGSSSRGFMVDSIQINAATQEVSPSFFDVFRINIIEGNNFSNNQTIHDSVVILGGNTSKTFGGIPFSNISKIKYIKNVVGFANPVKKSEFENYQPIIYSPFTESTYSSGNISFRIKEEVDKKNHIDILKKELTPLFNISPYFFVDIEPLAKNKEQYMQSKNYYNEIKSIGTISFFLLINIFLGIFGTFWLRIQSRRNDIGIQMAFGASSNKIKLFYSLEALFLLFVASIIGFIVAVNIIATGVLDDIGISAISSESVKNSDILQLAIDYFITFGILAIVSLIGVGIPSSRASKTSPALVLKSE